MRTETLSTLKINKLSQEQYDRELANGNIDENAIYLTPDSDLDLAEVEQTLREQGNEIELVKGDLTSHTNSSNAQFALIREEFAGADAETLKTAKEYSDANKNSAIDEAKAYTDQEIEKLVTDTEFEGVLSTIQDIQNVMATDEELAQALETANGKKVDKGAKGSAIQPIYFDDNGAQPIAYTIEKSVPADAKFSDTTYTLIKDSINKKIQLMSGETLISEVDDNNTTYTIDSSLSTSSVNPVQNKVVSENINNIVADIEEINSKDLFETKRKEGSIITVNDSAEAHFAGMKLFGKTTQNGTPTPEAPVPLVSVGDSGSFTVTIQGENAEEQSLTVPYTLRSHDGVQDEIDFARGVLLKRVFYADSFYISDNSLTNMNVFSQQEGNKNLLPTGTATSNFTNHSVVTWADYVHLYNSDGAINVFVPKTLDTAEVTNTLRAICLYATPIEIPLTEAELNAYRQLYANKGNTTILSEADMEVEYVVDSTSAEYIENRLNEAISLNLYPNIEYKTNNMFNGKPVYVKMFNVGSVPIGTEKTIPHEISSLDTVIDTKCMIKVEEENIQANMSSSVVFYNNTLVWFYTISPESIKVSNGDKDGEVIGNISDCHIILHYTKI